MQCEPILALDVPSSVEADALLDRLEGRLRWVKIGLQMFTAYGPDWVRKVADRGFEIFLDLKLHDIPNTVGRTVDSLAALPIGMLTVHACGGREMLEAAQEAASRRTGLTLLGVTVLTSMAADGLRETGISDGPEIQVLRLAGLAAGAGIGGLVCSPLEVSAVGSRFPGRFQIVTPGIRPAFAAADDQKRLMTPAEAARAGASYLVIGRPIIKAEDPAAAVDRIREEIEAA